MVEYANRGSVPTPDSSCVICSLVAGTLPVSKVYEDEQVLAFMVLHPVNAGHLLVAPRLHYPNLADLPEGVGARMFTSAQRLAKALRLSGVRCEGVNLFLADGEAAFEDVFHCHIHVMPRFVGDAFQINADWSARPSREEIDAVAGRIRSNYERLLSEPGT